jgi:hypothetical protein
MTYRQELDALVIALEKAPTGVLDENIIIVLKALLTKINALEDRVETLEVG